MIGFCCCAPLLRDQCFCFCFFRTLFPSACAALGAPTGEVSDQWGFRALGFAVHPLGSRDGCPNHGATVKLLLGDMRRKFGLMEASTVGWELWYHVQTPHHVILYFSLQVPGS